MQVVSIAEAINNFKTIFERVHLDHEEVIINKKGKENVVVIPFEEYEVLKKSISCDDMTWDEKEIENIGKIGFNSQSFVEDSEDYSKW